MAMHGFALSLLLSFSIPGSEIVSLVRDRFLDGGKAGLEWAQGRDPQLERALDLLSHS